MCYGSIEYRNMRREEAKKIRQAHSKASQGTGKPAQRNTESLADFKKRMQATLKGTYQKKA